VNLYAVMMARDEADVIGYTISHLLAEGVDRVIVADNLSTDDTRSILESFDERVTVVEDNDPAYHQALKMSRLARQAYDEGADWVLPVDADELFYCEGQTLAEFFAGCEFDVVAASVWDHIATRSDSKCPNPWARIEHRRKFPQRMFKVAFRAHPEAMLHVGNHDVERPGFRTTGMFGRHAQYRSLDQMVRKVTHGKLALEAANLHEMHGAHWRQLGAKSDNELAAEWQALCDEPDLVFDPAPYRGEL
jgi:glycosyltransferase involved in cell wall biosynthesis